MRKMSLADASPAATLPGTKKKYSIQCPNHEQEGQIVYQVFESAVVPRKRSHELTSSLLTPSSRSSSPDRANPCLASNNVPTPRPSTLIRDISLEEELQSKVLHLAQEIAVLKNKCSGQNRENLKLSQSFATYQQESQAVVDALRKDCAAKMEETKTLLAKSEKAREDILNEKSALEAALKQTLEMSEKEKSALKAELEQTKQEYDKVLRANTRAEALLDRTERESLELRQENRELRKEVQALKNQKETGDRANGSKLKESEMRNDFYQMLFEIAANKVRYIEEKQPPQQSPPHVFSPDGAASSPLQEFRPLPSVKRHQGAAIPRSDSCELLQILEESILNVPHRSSDTQSLRSGDSAEEGRDSERLESAGAEQQNAGDSNVIGSAPPPVRGHSAPNILSPYFLQPSELPKFDFICPTESDETSSGASTSFSGPSSELSDFLTSPNRSKTPSPNTAPFKRRGAHRVPLLKSYTVDDERLTPPRLKFRSNTEFDQSEDISLDSDYVIVVSSASEAHEPGYCDCMSVSSHDAEVKSSSRSGFKILKQRRNGITDLDKSFPPAGLTSPGKSKKSKGRELADMLRKFTGGDSERNKGNTPRKRSKAVKDDHISD